CAVLTADGRLIDQMGPDVVANPAAFQAQLLSAFAKYSDDLYEKELRPLLENPASPKAQARLAVQTVYRLGIRHADKAIIGLLDRKDVTSSERARLYGLIAFLGTEACITKLLDTCEEPAAVDALGKADLGALQYLLPALPTPEGAVTPRQLAAYQGAWR